MKTKIFTILLLFIIKSNFGQINYEKGYIIDNFNKKIECFIKNNDWKNNPVEFTYKLEENGTPQKGTTATIKEFGVYGYPKYIRAYIEIDRSSNFIDNMSNDRNPIWSNEVLFLKQLVKGSASLYQYKDIGLEKYFYSTADTSIRQLVYKKYLTKQDDNADPQKKSDGINENNKFRQQLWSYIKCPTANENSVKGIMYNQNQLVRYFKNYNKCVGDSVIADNQLKKRDCFNLKIAPGINYSSLVVTYSDGYNYLKVDFDKKLSFRIGLEAEYILPFNKNKWGLIFEPNFQYYSSDKKATDNTFKNPRVRYKTIEFPLGVRYYIFLNKNTTLFLNTLITPPASFNLNSTIDIRYSRLDITDELNFLIGGGVSHKRISGEIRYLNKSMLSSYLSFGSEYTQMSFIIGYKIL